jgi:phenylpropionate dioxygenase-like ring-hydroxylating dioxygenase large terminal subunit/putative sterol carrier protein
MDSALSVSPRFPFGIPRGWFVLAMSSELTAGPPTPMRAFGRDLVAYRGESGEAHVVDAYCPHLGAHLGHGGCVEGESIRCPFHRWRFDAEGRCTDVPGSPITPDKARLRTYPVKEQNGTVFVFFDPAQGAPWDLPELDEEGWTPARVVHWKRLRTHPQEIFENTVDTAHIGPVHDGRQARLQGKPRREGERMIADVAFTAPGDIVGMPGTLNDVELNVTMVGLGVVIVQTHVTNVGVRARQRICVTPLEEDVVEIRGIVQVREQDDPEYTEELARIFYEAYVADFAKDFPIWENKRYLTAPLLSPVDGPVGLYRRWCEQFYDEAPVHRVEEPRAISKLSMLRKTLERKVIDPARATVAAMRERASTKTPSAEPTMTTHAPTASAPKTSSSLRVASADEYFETLPQRFVPSAARGVDAVFQWELGDGTFHARVRDGQLELSRGAHEKPTVALVMAAEDYVKVVNGDIDGTWAFTSGLGKVKGSLTAAMKMRTLFPQ